MSNSRSQKIHFGRIYFIVAIIVLFWVFLEVRLYQVQIKNHDYYTEIASNQVEKKIVEQASRGIIFDRNNIQLATNLIHYDLGVDKNNLKSATKLAKAFSSTFGNSQTYYLNKIKKNDGFAFLERKVSEKKAESLKDLDEPGLVKKKNYRRFYPFSEYCSQIIGFTDVDDKGASGLELQFEDYLKGKNGWTVLQADAKRRLGYSAEHPIIAPQSGADIILTIDKNYQTIAGENLKAGVKKYNAKSGIAILMQPKTGEILAISTYPAFNPNQPARSDPDHRRNRFVTDVFEPGSTFKLFAVAALLQEGIKKVDDIVFCENGSYKYYDHTVKDSKGYGWLSLRRVFENSSNIGMVKLIQELPSNVFYRYLKNFNFGSETGINLNSENSGRLEKPKNFSGISKGMISHGYEIGTTALQLTNAYCAVVNGGNLMKPYIVEKIVSPEGDNLDENSPQVIRQVLSDDVAEILKGFMIGTVERGTGTNAQIGGFKVGGKTGTAQKYDTKKKRYIKGKYISSFIGFAPYEDPEFVLAVFLDEPKPQYYGGQTAAPIFKTIMSHLLKIAPGFEDEESKYYLAAIENENIPDLKGMHVSIAKDVLLSRNIDFELNGEGEYISGQKVKDDEVILQLEDQEIIAGQMPNVKGLTVREALKKIDFSKLRVKIDGGGKVKKQTVKAGTHINNAHVLTLSCDN